MVNEFDSKIKESLLLFDGSKRKKNTKTKVPANYLPVGHFIGNVPKFYEPEKDEKWQINMAFLEKTKQYKENPIIIGYDDKTKSGINVKFKLRTPIQNIKQYKDSRQIEKGAVCSTKSKSFLQQIAKKLGLNESDYSKSNVDDLCSKIRTKLIYYELKARQTNSDIKYFYFLHEIKPETVIDVSDTS
jgi:diphthamide synthase (EF-2-diphthine--ammonia ligase)